MGHWLLQHGSSWFEPFFLSADEETEVASDRPSGTASRSDMGLDGGRVNLFSQLSQWLMFREWLILAGSGLKL